MGSTTVSSPGKVLLAGGYLVLDQAYTGLVLGLSARIYVTVEDGCPIIDDAPAPFVYVRSPQFGTTAWLYHVVALEGDNSAQVNPIFR